MGKKKRSKEDPKKEVVQSQPQGSNRAAIDNSAPPENVSVKTTEKKTQEANTPPSKKKNSFGRKLLIVFIAGVTSLIMLAISAGITYLLTSKWEGDKCDKKYNDLDTVYKACLSTIDDNLSSLDVCEDDLDACLEEPICDCTDVEGPVQTIRIGESGALRIPSGWMLAGVNTSFRYLTEAEEVDMIKPENNGLWPIFESTEYILAVSEDTASTLTITENALFVPGATGFLPTELTESFELLSEEKNDDNMYGVRVSDGLAHRYLLVEDNPDYQSASPGLFSADAKYIYSEFGLPTVAYNGATKYLEDADQIFIEACLRNSIKLCDNSAFE